MTTKQCTESALGNGQDQAHNRFFCRLPAGHALADLFVPTYWGVVVQQKRLNPFDIIRVRADDGSFDCQITVISVMKGGALVELWPKMPANADALTKPREPAVVPIGFNGLPNVRVEQQGDSPDGRKYRVLAVNAGELSRHASRQEAQAAMEAYLEALHMRLPTEEECVAARAKMEADEERRVAAVGAARKRAKAMAGE